MPDSILVSTKETGGRRTQYGPLRISAAVCTRLSSGSASALARCSGSAALSRSPRPQT